MCRTVRKKFPGCKHIVSLACIGIRGNPFGGDLSNPSGVRSAMVNRDPRHHALFGACYAIAWVAAMLGLPPATRPDAVALSELVGDHGAIADDGKLLPIGHVLQVLFRGSGALLVPVQVGVPPPHIRAPTPSKRGCLALTTTSVSSGAIQRCLLLRVATQVSMFTVFYCFFFFFWGGGGSSCVLRVIPGGW